MNQRRDNLLSFIDFELLIYLFVYFVYWFFY